MRVTLTEALSQLKSLGVEVEARRQSGQPDMDMIRMSTKASEIPFGRGKRLRYVLVLEHN